MKKTVGIAASLVAAMGIASAERPRELLKKYYPEDPVKWSFTAAAVFADADVKIVDSEVIFDDDTDIPENVEVALDESMNVSAQGMIGVVGYRLLPFFEVIAQAGILSTNSEVGIDLTITPEMDLDILSGPILVSFNQENDVSGHSFGLGGRTVLPLHAGEKGFLGFSAGYMHTWNEYEDGLVSSNGSKTSLNLVYLRGTPSDPGPVFTLGGAHNWLTREVEREAFVGGSNVLVRVEQEFEAPWTIDGGIAIPVADKVALGFGVSTAPGNSTSGLISLTYRH